MAFVMWIMMIIGPMYVLAASPQWKDVEIGVFSDIRNNVHSALKVKIEKRNPEVNTLTTQWSKDLDNCKQSITAQQTICKTCTKANCTEKDFVEFGKKSYQHIGIHDLNKLGRQIEVVIDSMFTTSMTRRKRSVGNVIKTFTQNCFDTKCPSCKEVVGSNSNWFTINAVCGDDLLKRRSVLQWHGVTIGKMTSFNYEGYGLIKVQVPATFNSEYGSFSKVQVTFKLGDQKSDTYQSKVPFSSAITKQFVEGIATEYWERIGM